MVPLQTVAKGTDAESGTRLRPAATNELRRKAMVSEKKAIIAALQTIPALQVWRSSERAVLNGKTLPCVAVDYSDWSLQEHAEDGKQRLSSSDFVIYLFVESKKDDEDQEDELNTWLELVIAKFVQVFPFCQVQSSQTGTVSFGGGQAFGVVFSFSPGPFSYP